MQISIKANLFFSDLLVHTQNVEVDRLGKPPDKIEFDGQFYYLESWEGGLAKYLHREVKAFEGPEGDDDDIPF